MGEGNGSISLRSPVVGIPKAMLYYREHVKWETFLRGVHAEVLVSPDTDMKILGLGTADAVDEMCLSAKIFFGHVHWLIGKCDYILVPWVANYGRGREYCTTFTGMYDICRNIYRDSGQKFLTYCVDVMHGRPEELAFLEMGTSLGAGLRESRKAYKAALKAYSADWKDRLKEQERQNRAAGLKVLVAAHPYVMQDPYFGTPVIRFLEEMGVTVLTADVTDREEARKRAGKFSPTMKWEFSREMTGGLMDKRRADGIVFMTAFPCGPDSMVTDLFLHKKNETERADVPVLNLVLDAQSGTAGLETRLESFVDILRLKTGTGTQRESAASQEDISA